MGIITKMEYKEDRNKYWIHVDTMYLKEIDKNKNVVIDIKDLGEKKDNGEETVRVYVGNKYRRIRKRIVKTLKNTI